MTYKEFIKFISSFPAPVILLEGTRKLPYKDNGKLVTLGSFLAKEFPNAIFRSGNASGSDAAFSKGVCSVDPGRMQNILPFANSGKSRLNVRTQTISFKEITKAEEPQMIYETKNATPEYKSLMEAYQNTVNGRAHQTSLYLLRDTLKVIGSASLGLAPANFGIFYVNRQNPCSGGTGHTMRVCEKNNIPVVKQNEWMKWNKSTINR